MTYPVQLDPIGWTGASFRAALEERPKAVLKFFSYGVILQKINSQGATIEYPIDPTSLAAAFADEHELKTGLLKQNTLSYRATTGKINLTMFFPGGKRFVHLEGEPVGYEIPLPPMVVSMGYGLVRNATNDMRIFAVKRRPSQGSDRLYHMPLPNIYSSGNLCYGSVRLDSKDKDVQNKLQKDLEVFMNSSFGGHSVSRKSEKYPDDVRRLLSELHRNNVTRYPMSDLVACNLRLEEVL